MRARRHFQPSLDSLPMRLAPSGVGAIVSPSNPLAGSSSSPTAIISPNDPTSGSGKWPFGFPDNRYRILHPAGQLDMPC